VDEAASLRKVSSAPTWAAADPGGISTACKELLTQSHARFTLGLLRIFDITSLQEVDMPFEEKATWVSVVIGLLVPVVYFATVLGQLADTPAADIAYQKPLIIAVVASIILIILGTIAMAIATAASAEITGRGSVDDIDRKDERDVGIRRRGDVVGYYVATNGALGALIITMLEYDYFWIANTLYLSFVVAGFVAGIVKLRAYHRGF